MNNIQMLNEKQQEEKDSKMGTFSFVKGDTVKVNRSGERFWVIVTVVRPNGKCMGVVDNDLISTDKHGLQCDDIISFTASEVLDVFHPEDYL